jgi:flagellar assembly factor FliW
MTAAQTDLLDGTDSAELPILEFVAPMPGFAGERKFLLVRVDDSGLVYSLSSVETPGLRFLVVPTVPFFPEYSPEIDDEALASLGADETADLMIMLVVTAGPTAAEATVNLMAPIVVHEVNRRAVQLVLNGLPVRAPLMSAGP